MCSTGNTADRIELNYLLARSGSTITHTTLSPMATTDFEKSHILAMAPALRDGTTMVSPAEHFFISSEALASLSRKPADTGRQYRDATGGRTGSFRWTGTVGSCALAAGTINAESTINAETRSTNTLFIVAFFVRFEPAELGADNSVGKINLHRINRLKLGQNQPFNRTPAARPTIGDCGAKHVALAESRYC
jgi:hypothetical protein